MRDINNLGVEGEMRGDPHEQVLPRRPDFDLTNTRNRGTVLAFASGD
jgi:hypothetical protein